MTKKQFHELVSRSAVKCEVYETDADVRLKGSWAIGVTWTSIYRPCRRYRIPKSDRLEKLSNQAAKYKRWLEEVTNQ